MTGDTDRSPVADLAALGVGITLAAAVPVALGMAGLSVLLGAALFGFLPLLFLGGLWVGVKGDEFFGVEDAWAYEVPSSHTDEGE